MTKNKPLISRAATVLGSSAFFWVVVGLLGLQALWIALSGRYPMAFDEDYHLGIIQLYAGHLSPFWGQAQPGCGVFGAVARDPSYLYHYLMSFPYLLVKAITANQMAQVIVLRGLNIGLFAGGLILFRKLLLKTGAADGLVNLTLLVFVLLPITPLLAAQINYDNLLFPITALILLLALDIDQRLRTSKRLDVRRLSCLISLALLACLIKYSFLPLAVAVAGYGLVRLWQSRFGLKRLGGGLWASWKAQGRLWQVGLCLMLLIAAGLFTERYGLNLARYHTPVPDCASVLSVEQCQLYGPWQRDYELTKHKPAGAPADAPTFAHAWFYGMWFRTFFAVDGPDTGFQTRAPLLAPGLTAMVLGLASAGALLISYRRLLRRYDRRVVWLFVIVSGCYVLALWLDGFEAFHRTGKAVAINGRYLLLVLPMLIWLAAAAWNELLRKWPVAKLALATVAVLGVVWGGGALTYVLRSNDAWYWPASPLKAPNHFIQHTVGPITPGYYRTGIDFWP